MCLYHHYWKHEWCILFNHCRMHPLTALLFLGTLLCSTYTPANGATVPVVKCQISYCERTFWTPTWHWLQDKEMCLHVSCCECPAGPRHCSVSAGRLRVRGRPPASAAPGGWGSQTRSPGWWRSPTSGRERAAGRPSAGRRCAAAPRCPSPPSGWVWTTGGCWPRGCSWPGPASAAASPCPAPPGWPPASCSESLVLEG